jgi:diguanylate cyclase (GGDEF)-like protein
MHDALLRIGRVWSTLLLTLISVVSSVGITAAMMFAFGFSFRDLVVPLAISITAPGLIAPVMFWYVIGLIFKVQRLEREQRRLATYDHLSGVMSRRVFLASLDALLSLATRQQSPLSLAYIDVDDFRGINEAHGHLGGDEVIRHFGECVRACLRESDLSGRVGGEEFMVALPDTEQESAEHAMRKLQRYIAEHPARYGQATIAYTISVGLTVHSPAADRGVEPIIARADRALYIAKHTGKNRIVSHEAQPLADASASASI